MSQNQSPQVSFRQLLAHATRERDYYTQLVELLNQIARIDAERDQVDVTAASANVDAAYRAYHHVKAVKSTRTSKKIAYPKAGELTTTERIKATLAADGPMTVHELTARLQATGWTTTSTKPADVVQVALSNARYKHAFTIVGQQPAGPAGSGQFARNIYGLRRLAKAHRKVAAAEALLSGSTKEPS